MEPEPTARPNPWRRVGAPVGYLVVLAVLLLIPSPSDAVTILAMLWVAGGMWWLWRSLGGSRRPTRRR